MSSILSLGCLSIIRLCRPHKRLAQAYLSCSFSAGSGGASPHGAGTAQRGRAGLTMYPLNLVPSYCHTCFKGFHSNVYCNRHVSEPESNNCSLADISKVVNNLASQDEAGDVVNLQTHRPGYCSHTSVQVFKSHWLTVFAESVVPEPYWSVKWITEHVQNTYSSPTKVRTSRLAQTTS